MDEFEAFEHLLIYVYSLEKNVFLTKKQTKKVMENGFVAFPSCVILEKNVSKNLLILYIYNYGIS